MTIDPDDKETWDFKKTWSNNSNILGLIVFSLVIGRRFGNRRILIFRFEGVAIVV